MRKIATISLSLCCLSSCSYEIVKERDVNTGEVYRQRVYKNAEKQERYFDTKVFKYWYKEAYYPKDTSIVKLNDSTVVSGSITFYIKPTDSLLAELFFSGVISGKVFDNVTGSMFSLERTNLETGVITPPQKTTDFVVRGFKLLNYFEIPDNKLRIKFKITPYTYYVEIESDKFNNQGTISDFINHSRLTFIHKCCAEI